MKYTRLTHTQYPFFAKAWNLYKQSFPPEERRQLRTQKKIMNNPLYHFEWITNGVVAVGFILWWGFEDLRYIEHLATFPRLRGKGYGLRILKNFIVKSEIPVLLEVEHPTGEISQRRINFYRRANFVLNHHAYQHPPYKKNGEPVSLMLMTHPQEIKKHELKKFLEKYHPVIHEFVCR